MANETTNYQAGEKHIGIRERIAELEKRSYNVKEIIIAISGEGPPRDETAPEKPSTNPCLLDQIDDQLQQVARVLIECEKLAALVESRL